MASSIMTTSIDVLPDDVLLDIFLIAKDYHSRQHQQIAISQVCKRWRSLALSTPLLWNKLHLESGIAEDTSGVCIPIAQMFFQRSAPLLMDVVVKDNYDTMAYARILEPYASRIRSLDMTLMKVYFRALISFLAVIGPRASNLRSLRLPRKNREDWVEDGLLPTEAPPTSAMELESLVLLPEACLKCLPFTIGSITRLELKPSFPTRSRLNFLFRNVPALSTLAIDVDCESWPTEYHFYSHDDLFDLAVESDTSTLIPSSSLQQLSIFFGKEDQSSYHYACGLEFLDVQNVKHLELHSQAGVATQSEWFSLHLPPKPHLSTIKAWTDRLFSLETLVLSSIDLLEFTGGSQKLIRSSHPLGINLVVQAAPTFAKYEEILSSFVKIASLTYYLPPIDLSTQYDGFPEGEKASCSVFFPITFIPTPGWRITVDGKSFQPHPLVVKEPMEEQPSCEAVDFIRYVVEVAKGGQIPVRFIDSPSSLPSLFSRTDIEVLAEAEEPMADLWESEDEEYWSDGYSEHRGSYGSGLEDHGEVDEFEDYEESDQGYGEE